MKKPRVGFAALEPVVRGGMAAKFILTNKYIVTLQSCGTAQACLDLYRTSTDVLIIELEKTVAEQVLAVKKIKEKYPGVKIILLVHSCSSKSFRLLKDAGIDGVVLASKEYEEMYIAIDFVMNRGDYFHHPDWVQYLAAAIKGEELNAFWCAVILTEREKKI